MLMCTADKRSCGPQDGIEGEQRLEFQQIYMQFCAIYERALEQFCERQQESLESFVAACQAAAKHRCMRVRRDSFARLTVVAISAGKGAALVCTSLTR